MGMPCQERCGRKSAFALVPPMKFGCQDAARAAEAVAPGTILPLADAIPLPDFGHTFLVSPEFGHGDGLQHMDCSCR